MAAKINKATFGLKKLRLEHIFKILIAVLLVTGNAGIAKASLPSVLSDTKNSIIEIGPLLGSILFATAGIIYALAQFMPFDKKAKMITVAVNLVIGAVVVIVLTIGSDSLTSFAKQIVMNATNTSIK